MAIADDTVITQTLLVDGLDLLVEARIPSGCIGIVVVVPGASANLADDAPVIGSNSSLLLDSYHRQRLGIVCLHHRGTAGNGGNHSDTSLQTRIEDIREVVAWVRNKHEALPLFLLGYSMGSHVVCRLATELKATAIGLATPAAYGIKAEGVLFGPEFTSEIRKPDSWRDSLVFTDLEGYSGHITVMAAENDQVIPRAIVDEYVLRSNVSMLLPGSSHRVPGMIDPPTARAAETVAAVTSAIFGDLAASM